MIFEQDKQSTIDSTNLPFQVEGDNHGDEEDLPNPLTKIRTMNTKHPIRYFEVWPWDYPDSSRMELKISVFRNSQQRGYTQNLFLKFWFSFSKLFQFPLDF